MSRLIRRTVVAGATTALAAVALGWLPAAAAVDDPTPIVSGEVFGPGTRCGGAGSTPTQATREQVDLLDDAWVAAAADEGLTVDVPVEAPDLGDVVDDAHPTTLPFASAPLGGAGADVAVSLRNLPSGDVVGTGAVGTLANANVLGPTLSVDNVLQDCAPYPQSQVGAVRWTENTGSSTSRNAVLFDFSTPLRAFGAWFGDLETRPGTTAAHVKLLDADGALVGEQDIDTVTEPVDNSTCGGADQDTDALGCGNQGTRWVGFVAPQGQPVQQMLVVVGDDDACDQVAAAQCGGGTEHLSWVGARALVDPPTLEAEVTPSLATALPDDGVSFEIDVVNTSEAPTIPAIKVDDVVAGLTDLAASGMGWTCVVAGAATCTLDDPLPAGDEVALTITGTVASPAGTVISNTATIAFDEDDPLVRTATIEVVAGPTTTDPSTTTTTLPVATTPAAPPAAGGGADLPATGGPVSDLVVWGAGLVAGGVALLALARARRRLQPQ